MSQREQNRFNQLVVKMLGEANRRIDDCFANLSGVSGTEVSGTDGWIGYSAVNPTRTAADDPTYTLQFAGIDLTGILAEGMPIKWTQNSIIRYGWISSAPVYSGGNTTFTVLTRLDGSSANYDILDTSTYPISSFFYGLPKQPGFGFPISNSVWTTSATDTTERSTSADTGSWTNLGGLSLLIPVGAWLVDYSVEVAGALASAGTIQPTATLSTTNNSETNGQLSRIGAATNVTFLGIPFGVTKYYLSLAAKTTYYLNSCSINFPVGTLYNANNLSTAFISACCSYL